MSWAAETEKPLRLRQLQGMIASALQLPGADNSDGSGDAAPDLALAGLIARTRYALGVVESFV